MTALQELGEQLLKLPLPKLRDMPIPEKLYDAIELAQRIKDREGLRRQRQYIGRLMRDVDPAPLRDALSVDGAAHRAEVAAMHSAERWRERILAEPGALAEFFSGYPQGEREKLEKLVAGARADAASPQHGRHYRQLYRMLRDVILEASAPKPAARPDADDADDADDDAERA
jgi:ribosome-associated protein